MPSRAFIHSTQPLTIKGNTMQYDIDMKSKYQKLFLSTQNLLLSFDGLIETKKERITTYSNVNGGICHMRTTKDGVDIGFLKGTLMEDEFNLLTGKGKKMRVLPLTNINEEIIKYYVNQAIKIDMAK